MSATLNSLGGVPDVITSEELALTANYLASLQVSSGQIPWFVDGHCDPWNHVEVAIAHMSSHGSKKLVFFNNSAQLWQKLH